MKIRAIATTVIEPSGALFVCPLTDEQMGYEYIYREANGLRWDRERKALCAHEPARWDHEELLQHIAATLREAFDEKLVFTEKTAWVGVPPELQNRLRAVIEKARDQDA